MNSRLTCLWMLVVMMCSFGFWACSPTTSQPVDGGEGHRDSGGVVESSPSKETQRERCLDRCIVDAQQCADKGLRRCEKQSNGCADWGKVVPCPSGKVCSGGKCADKCTDQCTAGQTRCQAAEVHRCVKLTSGCTDWAVDKTCSGGQSCKNGQCSGQEVTLEPAPPDAGEVVPEPRPEPPPAKEVAPEPVPEAPPQDSTPQTKTGSNPVTKALTGANKTYNVGPGKPYLTPDKVPWGALVAGDVVNIFYRAQPYAWKLCLRGKGTKARPIVINGVTDTSGKRPRLNFNGARTASGCNPGGSNNIFNTTSRWSLENYAGIIIRSGVSDRYGYKPSWLVIQNLELYGARRGAFYTNIQGQRTPYIGSPAAIWIQPSTDILLKNNVIYDNGFGVFTMAKNSALREACERMTLRNNRIYNNGVSGSYLEHNVYMQSTNPIVEGNYLGVVRKGSQGASYKSRSSGEIFRYNYVVSSARAVDWVHSEDQTPGIATQADYGTDYAYGNIIVNDCSLGSCAGNPIHYGGDNLGAQGDTTTRFTPRIPYRKHLYFYNNTVLINIERSRMWRNAVFDLSERGTRVDAWNNIFYFAGTTNQSWLRHAGDLRLLGNNIAFGKVANARNTALSVNYKVTISGKLITKDPLLVGAKSQDYSLRSGSPAAGTATGTPRGLSPSATYAHLPVKWQPILKSNGLVPRTAKDLGALESKP